jgi:hypothetical protein
MTFEQLVLAEIKNNHQGREKAITTSHLVEVISQKAGCLLAERRIREAISELRLAGNPIASSVHSPMGYFLPATAQEARETIGHFRSRVREMCAVTRGVERGLLAQFGPQMALDIQLHESHDGHGNLMHLGID